jgi:hypothetical protein
MPPMRLTARLRRRVSLLLVACLLFQLAAVSAYACTREAAPAAAVAAMPGMPDCPMTRHQPTPPSALCGQHCAPDSTVPTDVAAPSVPAVLMPPMAWQPHPALLRHVDPREVPLSRSDPPPRLRFCSLLI